MTAMTTVLSEPTPTGLMIFGGLLVIVAGCAGLFGVRRAARRRR
jgi:hypothetical protein